MKSFAARFAMPVLALLAASCGGGNTAPSGSTTATVVPPQAIRFQASWRGSYFDSTLPNNGPNALLTVRPIEGESGISAIPLEKVEARVGTAAPLVLTAPNGTDAAGRPQFVFDFGKLAEVPGCSDAFPLLQIEITVKDIDNPPFTKRVAACATSARERVFGGFSDDGTAVARFAHTSSAPINALATRDSSTGYVDSIVALARTSLSDTLAAQEGDRLQFNAVQVPAGTRVQARVEGERGTFAQSTTLAPATPFTLLDCCGRPAAGAATGAVELRIRAFGSAPDAKYTYAFRITDPDTGTVVGSQSDTIYGDAAFPLQVQRGQAVEMSVTPNDPRVTVEASANLGVSASASSNEQGTPAQFRVVCCSR